MEKEPQTPAKNSTQTEVDCWRAFDRFYCISLDSRPDRRKAAEAEFRCVGLADRIEFHIVAKHPTNSELGIFQSHIACLKAGLEAGAKTIAVFEDDVVFHRFSRSRLRSAADFLAAQTDWRLFFFGCFVNSSRKTSCPAARKVRYRCTAHAYAVRAALAHELVKTEWTGIPYDTVLKNLGDRGVYALYPSIAYQSGAATDNDNLISVDRLRRRLGGLRRLQRWNEFSNRHLVSLIAAHVIAGAILLALLLYYFAAVGGR